MAHVAAAALLFVLFRPAAAETAEPARWLVGAGIADVTGEAGGVPMMGYAQMGQKTAGIHQRLWSRAFVIAEPDGKRVAIVVADLGMIYQGVQQEVMRRLKERFGELYRDENVLLSATHTHSGPGGYSHYTFFNLTTLGFRPKTFEAAVAGIVRSIERAHGSLGPGTLRVGRGTLENASVNRSPEAYARNPVEERERWGSDIDPGMTVLRLDRQGEPIGAISWFATHAVSMPRENTLISGDNKGYASWEWEDSRAPGFVAAFAQSNPGDMSPNFRDGRARPGPTDDPFENTRLIGHRQSATAREIFESATEVLEGPIDFRFRYVDFSDVEIAPQYADGEARETCPAAFGQSFTAGTEDGRGLPWISEGQETANPVLAMLGQMITSPSKKLRACHAPRKVLLAMGSQEPESWSPQTLPIQLFRLGDFHIAAAPAEFTVMSGRRTRESVADALDVAFEQVVFAGYANGYAGYVTTPEEYAAEHYEAGFTYFGPWTLGAFRQELSRLALAMRAGVPAPESDPLPEFSKEPPRLPAGFGVDLAGIDTGFGEVVEPPRDRYGRGEQVRVSFVSAHPANDLFTEKTFLEIQQQVDGDWHTIATDDDWDTKFTWRRTLRLWSRAVITWDVPNAVDPGTYRIVHHGVAIDWTGTRVPFTGTSPPFTVE